MSMHLKWNNEFSRVLASAVAVLVATSTLSAIPRDPCDPPAPPVCCEEPKPGPFAFAYPYDVDLNCPKDFYFSVSGLMMQAKQDGMEFAIEDGNAIGSPPLTTGTIHGFSSDNHDWDFNPGMRVAAGFYLDHDAWNLDFGWTWLNITDYKHGNATTGGGELIPLWGLGAGSTTAVLGPRSSAVWNVQYNTFDMRLAKPYYVSRYFICTPHFGLRGGWIDQHFSVDYQGNAGSTSRNIFHSDNDFWGIGARAGLDTDWMLGKGWSLFGNIAASMLSGKFDIDENYKIPGGGAVDGYNLDHDFYQNVPNFEIALGVAWGKFFNKKRNYIGVEASYEFHEWWDQLNVRKFSGGSGEYYTNDTVSRGNFTLNGFGLKVQLDM